MFSKTHDYLGSNRCWGHDYIFTLINKKVFNMNKTKWQISSGRFSFERVTETFTFRINLKIEDVNYLSHETRSRIIYFHVANNEAESAFLQCDDEIQAEEIYLALDKAILNC